MKRTALIFIIFCFLFVLPSVAAQDDDGDGTPNTSDTCPFESGPAWALGCPDSDSDRTPDINDACPSVGGPASNLGCPEDQPQFTPTSPPPPPSQSRPQQPQQPVVQPQQPAEPEPTELPPLIPSGPSVSLPSENACVLTPSGGEPINLRAVPSLQGDVLGGFEPGNRASAGLPVVVLEGESWYLSGGGWLVGRLMAGTPLCQDLPVLRFAESGTTLVNQDNSLSPSIPVGIGETRPAQLYLMPSTAQLLQQLAPRLELPAGVGAVGVRFPSLRGPTNEILISLLMPLSWELRPDGTPPNMVNGVYIGYPQRIAEGETATSRDTLLVDMAAQGNRSFTLGVAGNGRLRFIGDSVPTGLRLCTSTMLPSLLAEGAMSPLDVCAEGQLMPEIAGIEVANIGGVLLLNADALSRASLLVYEGRSTELIVQLMPGPNPSGGSTPLLSLNQGAHAISLGFHRPTSGMILSLE